jgi:hypothetical protein
MSHDVFCSEDGLSQSVPYGATWVTTEVPTRIHDTFGSEDGLSQSVPDGATLVTTEVPTLNA